MDNVRVRVAGHDMAARVMTADAFQQLNADPQALRDLDVDIICLINTDFGQARMEVLGLGGGLVPWIQPHNKMQITVEKVHF